MFLEIILSISINKDNLSFFVNADGSMVLFKWLTN